MDRLELGERLARARDESGYSAERLAAAVGSTAGTLRRYEQGRNMPGWDYVCAVAAELELPLEYFIDGSVQQGTHVQAAAGSKQLRDLDLRVRDIQIDTKEVKEQIKQIAQDLRRVSYETGQVLAIVEHWRALDEQTKEGPSVGKARRRGPGGSVSAVSSSAE
jgi:transcriptional regulator with XRE-family HTH domain